MDGQSGADPVRVKPTSAQKAKQDRFRIENLEAGLWNQSLDYGRQFKQLQNGMEVLSEQMSLLVKRNVDEDEKKTKAEAMKVREEEIRRGSECLVIIESKFLFLFG
jgi:hypothetical protein